MNTGSKTINFKHLTIVILNTKNLNFTVHFTLQCVLPQYMEWSSATCSRVTSQFSELYWPNCRLLARVTCGMRYILICVCLNVTSLPKSQDIKWVCCGLNGGWARGLVTKSRRSNTLIFTSLVTLGDGLMEMKPTAKLIEVEYWT